MENFKESVIAWSKLAAIGARPIAESVGIDREFYARVLNKRRDLPDDDAVELGKALGLNAEGFESTQIQANLCRDLQDLEAIKKLGFELTYLAQIKTSKEIRGGSSLQKYVAIYFKNKAGGRISVMRMATERWLRLMEILGNPALPILEVETPTISHFNSISTVVVNDEWADFLKLVPVKKGKGKDKDLVDWLKKQFNNWLLESGAIQKGPNFSRRLIRKTYLGRLAEKKSMFAEWPEAVRKFSEARFLVPISTEFTPVGAVGLRNDGKRVFVYATVLKAGRKPGEEDETLTLPENLDQPADHALIFLLETAGYGDKYKLIFDGPVSSLLELDVKADVTGLTNSQKKIDTTTIFFTNRRIHVSQRLMKREEEGD
nr:hypothetical protein [uncultured Limnohabitans sp.]